MAHVVHHKGDQEAYSFKITSIVRILVVADYRLNLLPSVESSPVNVNASRVVNVSMPFFGAKRVGRD